ncbi:hypothetical protein [Streptomyces prasinopilosus]|uniref:hypothetical protein n=1 Tax=Streptomyces prasinopilosus TaxID=67344 RepID=UPI0006EBABFD|nr:hypothetical protein [Streptomyces prasinopilosus]
MTDEPDNVVHLFREEPNERIKRHMAEDWEKAFLTAGQSLSNPETATSARVAISVMSHFIRGHYEVGQITEEQKDSLLWWLGTGTYAADELHK